MKPRLVVLLTVAGDQLTKSAIRAALRPTQSIPLIPSVLHLTYVQNTGAAFGLFQGYTGVFILLSVAVTAWILAVFLRTRSPMPRLTATGLALVLSGALGNLIDRVRFGYVVDFIDIRIWPVFNVADSAITIGVGLLLWQSLFLRDGRRTPDKG